MTVLHCLLDHVKTHGDSTAFIFLENGEQESDRRTFTELLIRAQSVAQGLEEAGLQAGDRALLLFPSGLDFVDNFLGCLLAGVVAVPAYPPRANHSLQRLRDIAHDCAAKVVLATESVINQSKTRREEDPVLSQLPWLAGETLSATLNPKSDGGLPDPDQLAFLQYTSGSTGSPKGVMVTHESLYLNSTSISQAMQHRSWQDNNPSVFVTWLPLFHDMGLIGNVITSLCLGVDHILMPPVAFLQKPLRWLYAVSHYRGTVIGAPNFGYELCTQRAKQEDCSRFDLSHLDTAYNGSEPIQVSTLEHFYNTFAPSGLLRHALYPCYGMAEATLMISGGTPSEVSRLVKRDSRTLVSCGKAIAGHHVRIVNPETCVECAVGETGEIWFRGPSVAAGYWNKPELTQETFHAFLPATNEGPFLRTGDLGFLDELGELYIAGRLKDLIIIRGRNYYPHDVERTVEECHHALRLGRALIMV